MKKPILTSLILLFSISLYSQIIKPTRYNLDSLHFPTNKTDYKYIRLVENYNNLPNIFLFTEYTQTEKLIMKAISTKQDEQKLQGPRFDYYESGNKKSESSYTDNKLDGTQINWYENKNKKSIVNYVKGKKTGNYFEWYENGNKKQGGEYIEGEKNTIQLKIDQFWDTEGVQKVVDGNGEYEENSERTSENDKTFGSGKIKDGFKDGVWQGWVSKPEIKYTESYKDGKFISGKILDTDNIEKEYNVLEKKPEPKNGIMEFYQYVGRNYRTPVNARDISGKIYVTFVVDTDGKIIKPRILRDLGYGTGDEALRILKEYKDFIPGEQRGRKVKCMYSLPITLQAAR